MKTIRTILTLSLLTVTMHVAQATGTLHPVEAGTKQNTITLDVMNRLGSTLQQISATVEKTPAWITITGNTVSAQSLAADSTSQVMLTFDVAPSLLSGMEGNVDVAVYAAGMRVLRKTIMLVGAYPEHYALSQNYPNPFNPSTAIRFALPKESRVKFTVYDVLGREVRTLLDEQHPAGYFTQEWDGRNDAGVGVSSGAYFYRMTADGYAETKKMILMK